MGIQEVQLADRFDLARSPVLLNGTQALVRLMFMQKARDSKAGLNTGGYVTGYRGSPLGAVDFQMNSAKAMLEASSILFQPALNEDLAATALWGTQQAELRGEGRFVGVFGLWYGKGPGVDRSGDVFRHANMAGTSRYGGVLVAMGDDHTGESSTTLHQSEWAMVDAYVPVLSPAGVQEVLDYGVLGIALSRFSGNWVGIKCMKDTIEATSVVDGRLERIACLEPEFEMPEGGLNIRLIDTPREREARIIDYRRYAAEVFGRANRIDRRVSGKPGAKIGFVAAGKNWLDLVHALDLLGIDSNECERLGITTYKVGMTFPLDVASFREWAEGLELITVVEEKRKLIEVQVKEAIFSQRSGRRVYGWRDDDGNELFPTRYALDPIDIALTLGKVLVVEGRGTDRLLDSMRRLEEATRLDNTDDLISRLPYFCSGCPHNTSTKIPAGSRAYAGIGCHYMVQWMDRDTVGFTQMGGEGANWIGEAPFSRRSHVFQNMGDGTYNHSGLLAIRAAVAAGVNITFKILFNDAVAMTGGQKNDGELSAARIAHEVSAFGVRNLAIVYDENERIDFSRFPTGALKYERSRLDEVQRRFRDASGVSAIVYVQTCAAEKRRRRKRGQFPDPDTRVFINTDVCEGCGDCGVQSNCVSIVPVETEFGRKRRIDQSSCNKDFSCLNGFCPSFVTLTGAVVRKSTGSKIEIPRFPDPELPEIEGTFNTVITGVGGTGVVTIGALMAMAAHLDRRGVGVIEMAGLAQKGGAVNIHCRIAKDPEDISAIRVSTAEADAIIGCDLIVSAGSDVLGLMKNGRTVATVNRHETITGDFTRDTEFRLPSERLVQRLEAKLGSDRIQFLDSVSMARTVLGDAIYSNMILFGMAWQGGLVPLSHEAIYRAIELNGQAVDENKSAFEYGRWAAIDPDAVGDVTSDVDDQSGTLTLDQKIEIRARHLMEHSGGRLADRYRKFLDRFEDPELKEAVALSYHKLLAVKDEYEVARLHLATYEKARAEFEGDFRMSFHLAPPFLGKAGHDGRPRKREFGSWVVGAFRVLATMKGVRGTFADPFRYLPERRAQRALARQFEKDMVEVLGLDDCRAFQVAVELAKLPLSVKGFGPVWDFNREAAEEHRRILLEKLTAPAPEPLMHAAA